MSNPAAELSNTPDITPSTEMSEADILKRLEPKGPEDDHEPSQEAAEGRDESEEQGDQGNGEESPQEAAQEAADEGQEADEAEPAATEDTWLSKKHKITVQGEELEVTGDELRSGYMRQQDYTRKTQAHAEQAKEVAQAKQFISREYAERTNKLNVLESSLYQALVGDQEVYAQLVASGDVAEALKLQQDMGRRANLLRQAEENRLQIQSMQANQADSERQELLERGQQALLEAKPEWRDAGKCAAESAEVARYLMQNGYADDDLNNLYDHRAVLIAHKAMLYDRMQAVAQKKVATPAKEPPKPVRAGNANVPIQSTRDAERVALEKKFRKTGKDDDAVRLLLSRSK